MATERRIHRSLARVRASLDVSERKLVRERGGDIFRLESAQMKELQEFLVLWPEDEKRIFIKMYAEEVMVLENKYPYRLYGFNHGYRQSSVMRWLIGGTVLSFLLFLLFSQT